MEGGVKTEAGARTAEGLAIVIVTFRAPERLKRHLDALSRQSVLPDIVIIADNADGGATPRGYPFRIAVLRLGDVGPAGGFRAGARKAMEMGFHHIAFADDDALPATSRLIERLSRHMASGARAVAGVYENGMEVSLANHYLMVSRDAIASCGLHFEPFYLMCEDMEYFQRLGEVRHDPQAVVEHPTRMPKDSFRACLLARNSAMHMAISGSAKAFSAFFIGYSMRALYLAAREPAFLAAFARGIIDFSLGRTGRPSAGNRTLALEEAFVQDIAGGGGILVCGGMDAGRLPFSGLETGETDIFDRILEGGGILEIAGRLYGINRKAAGRDLVLANHFFLAYPPFSITARDVFAYEHPEGKAFLVRRNSAALSLIFTILALPLSLAFLPPALAAFYLRRGHYRKLMAKQKAEDSALARSGVRP